MSITKNILYLYQKYKYWGSCCRYNPSCSHYAAEAIERFGLFKGGFLALKRLISCNQLFPGGNDPVPQKL